VIEICFCAVVVVAVNFKFVTPPPHRRIQHGHVSFPLRRASPLNYLKKLIFLMIEDAITDYQFNPHYLKVFGNHQNTPPSHLNEGDFSLYPIFND